MPDAIPTAAPTASLGFWAETWRRFRRRKLSLASLAFVGVLLVVAATAPMIAGTKPIACKYKGSIYFPALGYFNRAWENPIFAKDRFRGRYYENLKAKDSDSWAIWPLVYQDPYRRVREGEWPGQPENCRGHRHHARSTRRLLRRVDRRRHQPHHRSRHVHSHACADFGACRPARQSE
jgi:hypothetical protein